ncbi:MAG: glucose/quinate/shikimate family membrane-bound PQQ-dependent dehydrogenase [Candidatus Pelagadaptatus aseana]|uniref:pyrroloquinoline quinone-dependent dehydrogenase n=1 Tax=Candidatus Pelagadaptatus aseana TaxID=3120508 RepID=UPI0039B2B061
MIKLRMAVVMIAAAVMQTGCAEPSHMAAGQIAPEPASGWQHYGGDEGGKHYSSAGQITRANVDQLEVAWEFRSGDQETHADLMHQTSAQATPLLLPEAAGESLVYCTPFNRIIALDPGSGEQRWSFDPKIDTGGDRTFRCRGLSYYEETRVPAGEACRHRLFTSTHDRQLIAVDALTGNTCSGFGNNGRIALYGSEEPAGHVANSSAPVAANGVVVTGSTIIDFAYSKTPRGTVLAFDTLDGSAVWQWDPLGDPETEAGHKESGSANVWAPISVDTDNNLVFLPTSAPSPDYYGGNRDGNNNHANSVVALNLTSGELVWSFQHVRHDLWDYDTPAQPILFDWNKDGETIPALAQLTKQSYVFILNRLTGESLWEITEHPVPPSQIPGEQAAATQPKPIAPPQLLDPFLMPQHAWGLTPWDRNHCAKQLAALDNLGVFTPLSEKLTLLFPGSLGGPNWGGGALLADQDTLLVNVNNMPFTARLIATGDSEQGGERDHPTAGERMRLKMNGTPYDVDLGALVSPLGIPCNEPPWGKLVAVSLTGGKILWEKPLGSVHEMGPIKAPFHIDWGTPNLGGGIATAGGLFFIGATMDRQIRAFDVTTGDVLWRHTLPIDATATPMTYVYKGKQYVVINAGGHAMFNRGQSDYLMAFALPEQ